VGLTVRGQRRPAKGLAWWVLGTAAVLVAGWWIADLFTNPVSCGCG
jgi:hypothetical protein